MPPLLREFQALFHSIPAAYRWPLFGMTALVISVLLAIILVSSTADAPMEEPIPAILAAPIVTPQVSADPVTDLFDPSAEQTAIEQRESAALAQIDNIFLNAYLLNRCGKLTNEEYSDTYQLLITYAKLQKLASTKAEAEALIAEHAKSTAASYQLVYRNTSCGDINREKLAADLDQWRRMTRLAPVTQLP